MSRSSTVRLSSVHGILLDIEGTTSSVAFVYEVLFPFAREHLAAYLDRHWDEPELQAVRHQIARDCPDRPTQDPDALAREVHRLMDGDSKATGLKQLQGLVWQEGYARGQLCAHVYPDVPGALRRWRAADLDVRIFSSGSVKAQKLFFGHTEAGDLLELFRGHYDTTTGPKAEPASYRAIAGDFDLPPDQILFLSDVSAELAAARIAGLQVGLVVRPGNRPVDEPHGYPVVTDFDQIEV